MQPETINLYDPEKPNERIEQYNTIRPDDIERFEREDLETEIIGYFITRQYIAAGYEHYTALASQTNIFQKKLKEQYEEAATSFKSWGELLDQYGFDITDCTDPYQFNWLNESIELLSGRSDLSYSGTIIDLDCYARLTGKTVEQVLDGYDWEKCQEIIKQRENGQYSGGQYSSGSVEQGQRQR